MKVIGGKVFAHLNLEMALDALSRARALSPLWDDHMDSLMCSLDDRVEESFEQLSPSEMDLLNEHTDRLCVDLYMEDV